MGKSLLQFVLQWGWVSFVVWLLWNNALSDFLGVGRMNPWLAAGLALLFVLLAPVFRDGQPHPALPGNR